MNVLVLSCSTGEGHNSAAKAIEEELKSNKINVVMKDTLSFGNKKAEKIVKSFFNNVAVKTPSIFGIMYKAGKVVSNLEFKSPIYYANTIYSNNMYNYIIENNINTIICTHLFPMEAISYLVKKKKLNIKSYAVLTDYTVIPFIEETHMDGYFIPDKSLEKAFITKKIPKYKIHSYGIPVSNKYGIKYNKENCRSKLKLPLNKKIILIMTGGIGCGNIIEMVDPLLRKTADDVLILVLTGKNKELYSLINKEYNDTKVKAIKFTDKVELYMDACDLLLSKPGGLSSTEAVVKNVPLIHTFPIPGCETENATFFSQRKMSIQINNIDELIKYTNKLLNDEKAVQKMLSNQKTNINKNATKAITKFVIKDAIN